VNDANVVFLHGNGPPRRADKTGRQLMPVLKRRFGLRVVTIRQS